MEEYFDRRDVLLGAAVAIAAPGALARVSRAPIPRICPQRTGQEHRDCRADSELGRGLLRLDRAADRGSARGRAQHAARFHRFKSLTPQGFPDPARTSRTSPPMGGLCETRGRRWFQGARQLELEFRRSAYPSRGRSGDRPVSACARGHFARACQSDRPIRRRAGDYERAARGGAAKRVAPQILVIDVCALFFSDIRNAAPILTVVVQSSSLGWAETIPNLVAGDFDDNTMFCFHFYIPGEFTHQGVKYPHFYGVPFPITRYPGGREAMEATILARVGADCLMDDRQKKELAV
jgi:hypothetical protein